MNTPAGYFWLWLLMSLPGRLLADEAGFYTLEVARLDSVNQAREQAYVASGLVTYPCRILNEMGSFVVRCGQSDQENHFKADSQKINALGFMHTEEIKVAGDELVLFWFEPISLNSESQQYLIEMAQKKQSASFKAESQALAGAAGSSLALSESRKKQGEYFVDRGWQAYKEQDFDFAFNMFKLAKQIDEVSQPAEYGMAVVKIAQEQWQLALELLESLYQQKSPQDGLIELLVESAFNAREFFKARLYVDQLPAETRIEWRERLRGQALIETLASFDDATEPVVFSRVPDDFSALLDECNPYNAWLDYYQYIHRRQFYSLSFDFLKTLLSVCLLPDQQEALLYKIKPRLAPANFAQLVVARKSRSEGELLARLNKIHGELLLELAAESGGDLDRQLDYINQALALNRQNFTARLMLAWNDFHRSDFTAAHERFDQLWLQSKSTRALEGKLYSLAALGRVDQAIELAKNHQMSKLWVNLLKTKLGSPGLEPELRLTTARIILQYDPLYVPAHSSLAWHFYNAGDWQNSEQAFMRWLDLDKDNHEALQGLVYSLGKQQEFAKAKQLAKGRQSLQLTLDKEQASQAFARQDYRQAVELLRPWVETLQTGTVQAETVQAETVQAETVQAETVQAETVQAETVQAETDTVQLLAWAYFHLKQWGEAENFFRQAFAVLASEDLAEAIMACLRQQNKPDELADFAKSLARHEASEAQKVAANYYHSRGATGYAAELWEVAAEKSSQETAGRENSNGGEKSHGAENSQLPKFYNAHRAWVELGWQQTRFDETYLLGDYDPERLALSGGLGFRSGNHLLFNWMKERAELNEPLALSQIGRNYQPSLLSDFGLDESVQWGYLAFEHNTASPWGVNLGISPAIEAIDPNWLLGGYLEQDWGKLEFQSKPVFESALAYFGYQDPYSAQANAWGAVTEKKLSYQYQHNQPSWWSLEFARAEYRGQQVIDNAANQLGLAMGQSGHWSDLEKNLGGYFSYRGFDHNSNFYTFGHGGYFSPQRFYNLGVFAALRSRSNDWWQLHLGIGYFDWKTSASDLYPLSNFSALSAGERDHGVAHQLTMEKHWFILHHWDFGVGLNWQDSPQFERLQLAISLRYLFGKRSGAMPEKRLFAEPERPFALP